MELEAITTAAGECANPVSGRDTAQQCRHTSTSTGGNEKVTKEDDVLIGDLYALEFSICRTVRYHTKRKRFFDGCHRFSLLLSALTGTSAFFYLLGGGETSLAKFLIAVSTVVAVFDLVVNFSERARHYDHLQRLFSDLLAKITIGDKTEDNLKLWQADRILLQKDEPTILAIIDLLCHNEECLGRGIKDEYLVPAWQKYLGHFWPLDTAHIIKKQYDDSCTKEK